MRALLFARRDGQPMLAIEERLIRSCAIKDDIKTLFLAQPLVIHCDQELAWLLKQQEKSGKIPSDLELRERFPSLGNAEITEPPDFYYRRLREFHYSKNVQDYSARLTAAVMRDAPMGEIQSILGTAPVATSDSSDVSRWNGPERSGSYMSRFRSRADAVGHYPWAAINRQVGKIRRGQFIIFTGRPKMGKTWIIEYLAHRLWQDDGINILLTSGEISPDELQDRLDCIDAHLDYKKYVEGELNIREIIRLVRSQKRRERKSNAIVCPSNVLYSLSDFEALVATSNYPVVFYDGAYLIEQEAAKFSNSSLVQRMTEISRRLKRITLQFKVALVATYQVNREGEKDKDGGGLSNLSWADAMAQDADQVYILSAYRREDPWRMLRLVGSRQSKNVSEMIHYKPSTGDFASTDDWLMQSGMVEMMKNDGSDPATLI